MSKISLRYARALALALGERAAVADLKNTADELDLAAEVLTNQEAQRFFANPKINLDSKTRVTETTFRKMSGPVKNLLSLIVRFEKMREIGAIAQSFRVVIAEQTGLATAKIESAQPLEKKQLESLTAALRKMTGQEVTIETSQNPALLSGLKVFVGDELIDLSLAGKLHQLQKALN
ncbi:MAG: ATP synthase F1 subunit delta [Patescibacteria group bacterium]